MFLIRPQLDYIASDAAEEMGNRENSKLPGRASGPFRVLSVQLHTATIEEDDIPNKFSIDNLTLSTTDAQVRNCLHRMTHTST